MTVHDPLDRAVTRRRFLTGAGVVAGAAVAAGYGLSVWARGPSSRSGPRVLDTTGGGARGTLVVVELGGGNDGLNTVVPADGRYRDLRPTLAVSDPIELDAQTGLHPQLERLARRYRGHDVAIVEGVGVPEPSLSHFASLATWWSARPGSAGDTGWLGRYLDAAVGFDDPLAGVTIGPVPSPALLGERSFTTSITDRTGLAPSLPAWADGTGDVVAAWQDFDAAPVDPASLLGRVRGALGASREARAGLRSALGEAGAADGAGPGVVTPRDSLADDLELAARLVVDRHPPRIVYVSGSGDFDTHQGQAERQPALLADLDAGLERFFAVLGGAASRALVMTVSEFGRRAGENGSGTDHGAASAHLLAGPAVRGGRHGARPDLAKLDPHGNPVATTDFRAVYATVLSDWLGVDPEPVLGGRFEVLPLLA